MNLGTHAAKDAAFIWKSLPAQHLKKGYYIGYTGHGNLGDEALKEAIFELFKPEVVFAQSRGQAVRLLEKAGLLHWDLLILGGGTLIFRTEGVLKQITGTPARQRIVFGTGAANPAFWKDIPDRYGDMADWVSALDACAYLGVRGPYSKQALEHAGVLKEVKVLGDPALYFTRPIQNPKLRAKKLGVNVGTTRSPSQGDLMWGRDEHRFLAKFSEFLALMDQLGWQIEMVPVWDKDRETIEKVRTLSGLGTKMRIFEDYHSVQKTLDRLETFDVFAGEKLHSVILACCANTPSVMLEYQPKCRDFMASLELEAWTLRTDTFEAAQAAAMVEKLYERLEPYRLRLHQKCLRIKENLIREARAIMAGLSSQRRSYSDESQRDYARL